MRSPRPPEGAREMFAGLVGEVVSLFSPYTEASAVAIGSQFIVAFGNAVGRKPHFYLGETSHHTNEFLVACGRTAVGRKGEAANTALSLFGDVDPDWLHATGPGLSSGEGLISAVRDPIVKHIEKGKNAGEEVTVDPGVSDKRFLAVESEFSAVLKQFTREGNTLSNVLREAWDGRYVLRTHTKNAPLRATGAHVSMVGHATPEDLRRYLTDLDIANGTANRCIFVYVERERILPNPRRAPEAERQRLARALREVLARARDIDQVRFADDTERAIAAIYPKLSAHRPGLLGALLERGPAHVRRLAMIYAMLEAKAVVEPSHLKSALAFWDVAEASVRIIFGGRTGSDTLDRILLEMLPGEALSLEEIRRDLFSGHLSAGKLRDALALGVELGELALGEERGSGRPAVTVTRLGQPGATTKTTGHTAQATA